jgi:hypothetical protein
MNSSSANAQALTEAIRKARFILLHSGIPWMEDVGLLTQNYPHVWLDRGWDDPYGHRPI